MWKHGSGWHGKPVCQMTKIRVRNDGDEKGEEVLQMWRIHGYRNKAGYTAISCGRVGRGGNMRFPTFQLERDGPTDRPTDRPTDQRTDGQSLL